MTKLKYEQIIKTVIEQADDHVKELIYHQA